MPYLVLLEDSAKEQFFALDQAVKEEVRKKLKQIERDDKRSRHLRHGLPAFVEECGQYRIGFVLCERLKQKRVVFIGKHKEYETWCRTAWEEL